MTLILSNEDVGNLLTMPECIDALERAYVELAEGRGVTRTRSDCLTPTTRPDALYGLKSMDGVIPKLGVGAVRINSDILTWPKQGATMRRVKVPSAPGRSSDAQVTCFLNNLGLGYQFAAAGSVVYRKAKERRVGRELPTDWFTEDVHP